MNNNQMNSKNKTIYLTLCGLFASLTAVGAFLSIPLPFTPVPINLATIIVFLAGGLLDAKYGTLAMVTYTLLGLCGAPVFSGFASGPGVLLGPTGGYIVGYIICSLIIGLLLQHTPTPTFAKTVFAIMLGLFAIYALGTTWFMILTGNNLGSALTMCVLPFLIGDALKIILSAILIIKLKPRLKRTNLRV